MKLKGRSILVILLLIFGGYAYYTYWSEKQTDAKKLEDSRLLLVDYDQVDTVEIVKDSSKILLKRSIDGWDVKEPLKDAADNTAVDDFVKNMATEKIIDVARDSGTIDWQMYGLAKPLGTLTLTTTAGKKDVFEVSGNKNFEENAFVRRNNENRVLVVGPLWQNRVNKTVLDFRDRRFLRHKMAAIDIFKLKNKKAPLELVLANGQWSAPAHKDVKLDQNKVRDLLRGIADAKAAEYVDKLPATKSLFNLELKLADKVWTADVTQAADLKIYAKVSDPAFLLKMEPGAVDKLIQLSIEDLKEGAPSKDDKKQNPFDDQAEVVKK